MQKLENALNVVSSHPDYRILRRFTGQRQYEVDCGDRIVRGLYVDTETTGTDYRSDRIIELALLPFTFTLTGRLLEVDVDRAVVMKHDPGFPLTMETEQVTGITNDDLVGHSLDIPRGNQEFALANLVVAHNAAFDRKFVERNFEAATDVPWACSYLEVPWREFGAPAARLEVLAHFLCGIFYDAHRALIDCQVGVHVLGTATHKGKTALEYLIESCSQESVRVWAVGAPYHTKDQLKAAGYRWNDGTDRRPKAWYKSVKPGEELERENAFLTEVCGPWMRPQVTTTEAIDRYSIRDV